MSGNYERKLARILNANGYHVMRAPSSGSGTKRDLPDLMYARSGERPVCLELKTTSENIAYYTNSEVTALDAFADAFNAHARLGVRWKGDTTFYEVRPVDARRTGSAKYAVDSDTEIVKIHEPTE